MTAPLPQATRERLLGALSGGMSRSSAAAVTGINRDTLYEWMKDPEFADECEAAEARFEAWAIGRIRKSAEEAEVREEYDRNGALTRVTKRSDWRGTFALLTHHPKFGKVWREERGLQVSGPEGGPVQVGMVAYLAPSADDIAGYLDALRELPPEVRAPMLPDGLAMRLLNPGVEEPVVIESEAVEVLAPPAGPTTSRVRARKVPRESSPSSTGPTLV